MLFCPSCDYCYTYDPPPKRCAGCKTAWYCNSTCQKSDWKRHRIDCNPSRPITGADHIVRAVEEGGYPRDQNASIEYGFGLLDDESWRQLLEVYALLLKPEPDGCGVDSVTLNKWREERTLATSMNNTFLQLPEAQRGEIYAWFLDNQRLFQGATYDDVENFALPHISRAFRQVGDLIGLPQGLSMPSIIRTINGFSPRKRELAMFYQQLGMGSRPDMQAPDWVTLGFAALRGEKDREQALENAYRALADASNFNDISNAYMSGNLIPLFQRHGIEIDLNPSLVDILSSKPGDVKTVWWLLRHIGFHILYNESYRLAGVIENTKKVEADYGFVNCKSKEDVGLLVYLYNRFFGQDINRPFELHEACMQRRLFDYFEKDLEFDLHPKKKYQRLLKTHSASSRRR